MDIKIYQDDKEIECFRSEHNSTHVLYLHWSLWPIARKARRRGQELLYFDPADGKTYHWQLKAGAIIDQHCK